MKKRFGILLACIAGCWQIGSAQEKHAFWEDVQTIKNYDKIYSPPANPILFIGSSTIRKWSDLERTFAAYSVMNRGIGGAVINDITFYLNDLVSPYHPRQIFIYAGDNDMPEGATADTILARTKVLLTAIRNKLPDVPIDYISIKPSPSREKYLPVAKAANTLIKGYLQQQTNMTFIDIYPFMLTKDGKTRPELFVEDMLHMNAKGYAIWRAVIQSALSKKDNIQ